MIGNLAQIIAQAQGGLSSANLPPASNVPSNGGNVVGTGTNVSDLSYFSDPIGVDAQSADEVRAQATSNMMGTNACLIGPCIDVFISGFYNMAPLILYMELHV